MDNPWIIHGISIKVFCEVAACLRRFADLPKNIFYYYPKGCAQPAAVDVLIKLGVVLRESPPPVDPMYQVPCIEGAS